MTVVEPLRVESVAHGGDGVARRSGKTVFVPGTVPGDVVTVEITESRRRFDRARVVELVEPSGDRTVPRCRHTAVCGGCTWQVADYQAQLSWKREIVQSQLRHLGRLEVDVPMTEAVGPAYHYRNRMDYRVADGRLALHRRSSHDLVSLQECRLVVEPLAHVVSAAASLQALSGPQRRVTLRAGVNTGEMVAVVDHPQPNLPIAQAKPSDAVIHEVVGETRFRIGGRSFFQGNTAGAERLVSLVGEGLGDLEDRTFLDVFAGVGLFAATVGSVAGRVVALESDRRAVADLRVNAPFADVVPGRVEQTLASVRGSIDAVVIDPPRIGWGQGVAAALIELRPDVIMSVSCDPATFARDARSLVDGGYRLDWLRPLDLFPHTPHVELVARFVN